jgi:hypothetical protein
MCTPEEIIYQKSTQDDESIYFIESGQVEAITICKSAIKKKQKIIKRIYTLESGSCFGGFTFFTS